MKLEGRLAVIIGGTGGIGKEVCENFIKKGAKVVICDINKELGETLVSELRRHCKDDNRAMFCKCDVRSRQEVENAFSAASAAHGQPVEVAVITAAIIDENDWESCVDINIGGSIRFMNAALGHMGKDRGGQGGVIIVTSSISGVQGELWGPVYSATKHAIIGLARSWAVPENFSLHGVRINIVCPSATDTGFLGQVVNARHVDWHLNRLNTVHKYSPAEVAPAYIRFAEDDSLNGKALRMTRDKGNEFVAFPDPVYA